jgi:hypothetical protein
MSIDTDPIEAGTCDLVVDESVEGDLLAAKLAVSSQVDDFGLLVHLDGLFGPLLENAKVRKGVPTEAVQAAPDGPPPLNMGPSPEDIRARDRFLQALSQPSGAPNATLLPGRGTPVGTGKPLRGPGPPVFVGLDAEWVRHGAGRNKLLSVQFYLIGPTGQRLGKVIDVLHGENLAARPSLAESLDDLLDEGECTGVFDEWPSEVVLAGFFTRVDVPVFRDAKPFIRQLQGVNGTLASVGRPATLDLPLGEERVARLKSRHAYIIGGPFDPRVLSVRLIDAMTLAPPGASLAKVGDWLDLPKLSLPPGYKKSDMARFAREKPQQFHEYGLRDAEIAVTYVLWVLWFSHRKLGLKGLSATLSGLGVRLARLCMRRDGVHPDVALNFEKVRRFFWAKRSERPISQVSREPAPVRGWFEGFLSDAYLGGRNECYWFGPTPVDKTGSLLYDHDLAGCYVVSLAWQMVLDYDRIEVVRDCERYRGHVAGYAQVRFRFPDGTRFPCLPVVVGNYGLWFPLSGVSIATAPEIELALEMGAEVEVLFGVIIPWMQRDEVYRRSREMLRQPRKTSSGIEDLEWVGDAMVPVEEMRFPPEPHGDAGYRAFESMAIYTRTERLRYGKKSLPNAFMKGLGNSTYGKTGQGFKDKRAFGPGSLRSEKVGRSQISEAAVAALTSGFARAVLGEILWKLPPGALAVSATTDGLLVEVEKLDLSGTMSRRFQSLVDRVAPGTGMTEVKHLIAQAVAAKTRMQLTGKSVDGHDPVVAKGGIKVLLDAADGDEEKERELMQPVNQNRYVLDLFVNRTPGQIVKRPSSMSSRDQFAGGLDFQIMDKDMRLNMEFDFKRRPVNPVMVGIESHGVEHLAFNTVPWDSAEEGERVRVLFDRWRRGDGRGGAGHCLKTLEDWNDWQGFLALYEGNRRRQTHRQRLLVDADDSERRGAVLTNPAREVAGALSERRGLVRGQTGVLYATAKGGYLGIAIRTFLAAFVQRTWGLEGKLPSQSELAAWLTEVGYPTKLHNVKNAGRTVLHEHAVPHTAEVRAFLKVVMERFPGLEVGRFVVLDS